MFQFSDAELLVLGYHQHVFVCSGDFFTDSTIVNHREKPPFGAYFGFTNLMCKNPYLVMLFVFWGEFLVHGKKIVQLVSVGSFFDVIFDVKRWRCCL